MAVNKNKRTMLDNLIESVNILDEKIPQLIYELAATPVDDKNYGVVLANLEKSINMCVNYSGTVNKAIAEISAQKQKDTEDTEEGE